jgi:hypothetical protein
MSGLGPHDSDGLPYMVALSFNTVGFARPSTPTSGQEVLMSNYSGEQDFAPFASAGHMAIGFISVAAVTASGIYDSAHDTVMLAVHRAMAAMGRIAAGLRAALAWAGDYAARLTQLWPLKAPPAAAIHAFIADAGERASDLLSKMVAPAVIEETTSALGHAVTDVLHAPKDVLTSTVDAANALTDRVASTTQDVLRTTKTLARGINGQLDGITRSLNDISPSLMSRIAMLPKTTTDYSLMLRPLAEIGAAGFDLPQATIRNSRLVERFGGGEELRGCHTCLLQPLDTGVLPRAGAGSVLSGDGGQLSPARLGIIAGGESTATAGAVATGAAAILGGGGVAGSGPAAGIVNTLRSDIGRTARGVLGRQRIFSSSTVT